MVKRIVKSYGNRIVKTLITKKQVIELIFEYIERERKYLELWGSSEIILSYKKNQLFHLPSSQEETDANIVLHAHEILKESSSKVAIHSPGNTDILLFTLAYLCNYKEIIYVIDSHR